MRRFAKSAVLTATAALSAVTLQLAAPGAAQAAATDWRDCPDHYLCLWNDENYEGGAILYPESIVQQPQIAWEFNDQITSIWNRTGRTICFYGDADFQGGHSFCLDGGNSTPNVGADWNDRISSFRPI